MTISLHAPTLFLVLVCVTLTVGCLLFLSWLPNRRAGALIWWGSANIIGGLSAGLLALRDAIPDFFTVDLANALMFASYGCVWAGARRFCNAPVRWAALIAAPSAWLALCKFDMFYQSMQLRVMAASAIVCFLALATAFTLWRGRREHLVSRYPAIGWLIIHACFFACRIPLALALPLPTSAEIAAGPWFAVIMFEALLHIIALSFLQIAMIKERAELQQRTAALTDLLTGAPNRRALFEQGAECLARCAASHRTAALILLDLDHFKMVNDTYGHDAGDEVLRQVARTISEHLRLDDIFGRLGGEEFACLLPATSLESAMAVAEGLRLKIATMQVPTSAGIVRVAISCGLADTGECGPDLLALLKSADVRLYEAKAAGRNRVVGAPRSAADGKGLWLKRA